MVLDANDRFCVAAALALQWNVAQERIAVRAPPTAEMSASLSYHGPNCPGKTQNPQTICGVLEGIGAPASGSASFSPDQGAFLGWAP